MPFKNLYKLFSNLLAKKKLYLVRSMFYQHYPSRFKDPFILDYFRSATLELIAREINEKNLHGSIAELGVYQGSFSARISQVFPERRFYLFDTFEGFDTRNKKKEIENNFSIANQDFSNTSVKDVLNKISDPGRCVVRKGFFPETAAGINDDFVFVSLDTDLFEPIYDGLKFFYPRLVKGGYIFIHDYNNDEYKGAKEAVRIFCKENNLTVLPIPDEAGTAVLFK